MHYFLMFCLLINAVLLDIFWILFHKIFSSQKFFFLPEVNDTWCNIKKILYKCMVSKSYMRMQNLCIMFLIQIWWLLVLFLGDALMQLHFFRYNFFSIFLYFWNNEQQRFFHVALNYSCAIFNMNCISYLLISKSLYSNVGYEKETIYSCFLPPKSPSYYLQYFSCLVMNGRKALNFWWIK